MKVLFVEVCDDDAMGNVGAFFVQHHARLAGYDIHVSRKTEPGYDVELISVHHATNFELLAAMPKLAKWRIVGGHPMQNNPRPAIPFSDAICVGEGETWIKKALNLIEQYDDIEALSDLPGTIISKNWQIGNPIPPANHEKPLPDNPPYLNRPDAKNASWYIEIARGCPYRCHYCELGHSSPWRKYPKEQILKLVDMVDVSKTKRVNFFAPDEASHPAYNDVFDYANRKGRSSGFSSMRVESILHNGIPETLKTNHLIRIGLDGLSYATRFRVRKPITDEMIVRYFDLLVGRGNIYFKIFMIFGYPWEQLSDFEEFNYLIEKVKGIVKQKNVMLRIKWTPFIPQPSTPLADAKPIYNHQMVDRIKRWHSVNRAPRHDPGFYIINDGLMGYRNWKRQCELAAGDESLLVGKYRDNVLHPIHG